jgi:hypothetical protein
VKHRFAVPASAVALLTALAALVTQPSPASAQAARQAAPRPAAHAQPAPAAPAFERPIPYPLVAPHEFRTAVEKGTRTTTGAPGARYW